MIALSSLGTLSNTYTQVQFALSSSDLPISQFLFKQLIRSNTGISLRFSFFVLPKTTNSQSVSRKAITFTHRSEPADNLCFSTNNNQAYRTLPSNSNPRKLRERIDFENIPDVFFPSQFLRLFYSLLLFVYKEFVISP